MTLHPPHEPVASGRVERASIRWDPMVVHINGAESERTQVDAEVGPDHHENRVDDRSQSVQFQVVQQLRQLNVNEVFRTASQVSGMSIQTKTVVPIIVKLIKYDQPMSQSVTRCCVRSQDVRGQ